MGNHPSSHDSNKELSAPSDSPQKRRISRPIDVTTTESRPTPPAQKSSEEPIFSSSALGSPVAGSLLSTPSLSRSLQPPASVGRLVSVDAKMGLHTRRLSRYRQRSDTEPRLVPTIVTWNLGGQRIYVSGSFNQWQEKIAMVKSKDDFSVVLQLPVGTHRLKFVVDNEWKCSPDLPTAVDTNGNLINYIEVKQDDLVDGLLPGSIESVVETVEYGQVMPAYLAQQSESSISSSHEDSYMRTFDSWRPRDQWNTRRKPSIFDAEPPQLPPHFDRIILNATDMPAEDVRILPTPHSVCLNHLYALSIRDGVMGLASTVRYRQKFITVILYRPLATASTSS